MRWITGDQGPRPMCCGDQPTSSAAPDYVSTVSTVLPCHRALLKLSQSLLSAVHVLRLCWVRHLIRLHDSGVSRSCFMSSALQSVTFAVAVLAANESDVKLRAGVVNELVWEQQAGAGAPLVAAVQAGATLTNVAVFIDSSKATLHPIAATEGGCACACLHPQPPACMR